MISRETTLVLAEVYADWFASKAKNQPKDAIDNIALYEFLYKCDMPIGLMNTMRRLRFRRDLKDFILKLQTGEFTFSGADANDKRRLGQNYLERLAEDILHEFSQKRHWRRWLFRGRRKIKKLKVLLEKDGKPFRFGVVRRDPVELFNSLMPWSRQP